MKTQIKIENVDQEYSTNARLFRSIGGNLNWHKEMLTGDDGEFHHRQTGVQFWNSRRSFFKSRLEEMRRKLPQRV